MGASGTILQAGRPLTAATPLGENDLIPTRMAGAEQLSQPFAFTVDFLSPLADVAPADMLGKPVSMRYEAPEDATRFVHGLVRRWSALGEARVAAAAHRLYRAELVPWFWMLTLSADCRTFENKTVQEIVDAVFRGAGYADFRWRLSGATPTLPYVAQYQETNFAFVSRLLETYGLWYTFEHEAAKHTMVIGNAVGPLVPASAVNPLRCALPARIPAAGNGNGAPGGPQAGAVVGGLVGSLLGPLGTVVGGAAGSAAGAGVEWLFGALVDGLAGPGANVATEVRSERAVHTRSVAASDFHLLRAADSGTESSVDPGVTGERFEFLGDLAGTPAAGDAAAVAKRLIEAQEAGREVIRGLSTAPMLAPGTRTTFSGGLLDEVEVHVTAVAHLLETEGVLTGDQTPAKYFNDFVAIPAATPFRPERVTARPAVTGTQTATVVGAGGAGAIDVDANGCVLLQFPWDRGAGKDGASTHRVHLSHHWAGPGWGAVHLPRVGQLVLVEYLAGDPDRPIVTGRVYSKDHAHPYALPANKTQSGIKSRTLDGAAENFNELRFEDKKGEEHVFLQAEKDLTENVKHDRVATIQHHDHHLVVGGDGDKAGEQRLTVQKGNQVLEVLEGDQLLQAKKGLQHLLVTEGEQKVQIDKGPQDLLVKDGDRTVTVEKGNNTTTISATDATEADTITLTAKTKIELKVGGHTITIDSGGIVLKTGGAKVELTATAVNLKGTQIDADAQASLKAKGAQVSVEGQMTAVKGAMLDLNGSALVQVKGGSIMMG